MAAARSVEEKDQDLNRMASSFGISVKFISDNKGRGLFSNKNFKAGDLIFEENPVACAQFSWNTLYKYTACDHCMRSLETAQEMARRLSGNSDLQLPHPECCEIARSRASQVSCPRCQVGLSRKLITQLSFNICISQATHVVIFLKKNSRI